MRIASELRGKRNGGAVMQQKRRTGVALMGALAITLSIALGGCNLVSVVTPVPPAATGTQGHAGPAGLYPDPTLTPGDVFPGVTAREVCVSGYSKSVRAVSSDERASVYQRYGIANAPGMHEVDHFISLELGGSNMVTNLWPEPYVTPNTPGQIGAHEKDRVENYLHAQVCNGSMTLPQAQEAIRTDWYAVYLRIAK